MIVQFHFFPGKEFEHLIDSHGPDHVTGLMQKVISALEHLERFAGEADAEEATLEGLRTTITHLEMEGVKKNEERQRHAKVQTIVHGLKAIQKGLHESAFTSSQSAFSLLL